MVTKHPFNWATVCPSHSTMSTYFVSLEGICPAFPKESRVCIGGVAASGQIAWKLVLLPSSTKTVGFEEPDLIPTHLRCGPLKLCVVLRDGRAPRPKEPQQEQFSWAALEL